MTVERNKPDPQPEPETNVDETPNPNEQLKQYCDTLVEHLTADPKGRAIYDSTDYLAGVFVQLQRLVGGFNEVLMPAITIQHQTATMLRSLLAEAAATKQATAANQTLLQSIEKDQGTVIDTLKSIDESCKNMVGGLRHVYRAVSDLNKTMTATAKPPDPPTGAAPDPE